jgi:hypothetical protein
VQPIGTFAGPEEHSKYHDYLLSLQSETIKFKNYEDYKNEDKER